MAFNLEVEKYKVEYRGMSSGVSTSTGNVWMSLIIEQANGRQLEISVASDKQADVMNLGLRKGQMIECHIQAVAQANGSSYVRLLSVPVLVDNDLGTLDF